MKSTTFGKQTLFLAAVMLIPLAAAHATDYTIPNSFSSDTPALASEVNENFSAAKTAIDDNHARVSALEGQTVAQAVTVGAGVTAAAGGTALINAMAGISDATGTKPYVVAVGPGVFDLGASSLTMKSFVHLRGSGRGVTRIQSSAAAGTIVGAVNSTISDLQVENSGGMGISYAGGTPNPFNAGLNQAIERVTVYVSGTSATGISVTGGAALFGMTDVILLNDASGSSRIGMNVDASDPGTLTNFHFSDLNGAGLGTALRVNGPGVLVALRNSEFIASYPTAIDVTNATVYVRDSDFHIHTAAFGINTGAEIFAFTSQFFGATGSNYSSGTGGQYCIHTSMGFGSIGIVELSPGCVTP